MPLSALFAVGLERARSRRRNVLDYGAVADGVTDDSAAFAAAQAGSDFIELYIPAGVYAAKVSLRSNVLVWGPGATIRLPASYASDENGYQSVIDIGPGQTTRPDLSGNGPLIENVTIDGLTIDGVRGTGGPYVTYPDAYRFGIAIGNARSVRLRNLTIADCYTDGVFLAGVGPRGVVLENVSSRNNYRHGMAIIACSVVSVDAACVFSDNGGDHGAGGSYGDGIDIEDDVSSAMDAEDITIAGPTCSDNVGHGVAVQSNSGHGKARVVIDGGTYAGNGGHSVVCFGGAAHRQADVAIRNITGATIYCGGTGVEYARLIVDGNTLSGLLTVTGDAATSYEDSEITDNECLGIDLSTASVVGALAVERNTVAAPTAPTVYTDQGITSTLAGSGTLTIDGNTITGGCFGVNVGGPDTVEIANNDVSGQRAADPGSGYAGGWGISNSVDGAVISGNTVVDADGRGISNAGNGVTINNNTVTDCAGGPASGQGGIMQYGNNGEVAYNTATGNTGVLSFGDIYDGGTGNNVHDNVTT